MNYIIHLFLSDFDENLIVGNFIADDIKGKNYLLYTPQVQKGILLHRHIDSFTDTHTIIKQSKSLLVDNYNHWSGVLIDIFFGHFLVLHWKNYSNETITTFADRIHEVLLKNYVVLTPNTQQFLDYTIMYQRIIHFDKIKTIDEVLKSMAGRTTHISNIENATQHLLYHYEVLESNFKKFIPELILSVKQFNLNYEK